MKLRRLGKTDVMVSPLGLGCWQFASGFGPIEGFWDALSEETVQDIVTASLDGGINWFDTAEAYGFGRSERALSRALTQAGRQPGDVVVATKWWPVPRTAGSLRRSADARLHALRPFPIDLYQIHQPYALSSLTAQAHALADLVEAGQVRAVGVSNFSARQLRTVHAVLARRGVPLASNQVQYSLLHRRAESNGVLDACKELGVTLIAYSPLAQGLLSGKFHDDPSLIRKRHGPRRFLPAFSARGLARSRPVVEALREIARAREVTPSQVALNWLVSFHGDTVVAIPGASRRRHAEENVGALGLHLSRAELDRLDALSHPFR